MGKIRLSLVLNPTLYHLVESPITPSSFICIYKIIVADQHPKLIFSVISCAVVI